MCHLEDDDFCGCDLMCRCESKPFEADLLQWPCSPNSSALGGAASALIYNVRQRHPSGLKPMIDYDLVPLGQQPALKAVILGISSMTVHGR